MNRQERRRQKETDKVKTYTVTDEEMEKIKYNAANRAGRLILVKLIGLSVLALRDSFGFGAKRLKRFTDEFLKKLRDFEDGLFDLEDVYKILREETGINFEDLEG